jgi:hypothetical protein
MLKFPLWFLLILAVYAAPATAACNLFMADMAALVECAKSHEMTIVSHERQFQLMQREIDFLREGYISQQKTNEKLSERIFQLQGEIILLNPKKARSPKN